MKKFKTIERVRRPFLNYHKYLRLDRAEYGHKFGKEKKDVSDNYYPNCQNVMLRLANFHKVSIDNLVIGLGACSLIKDIFLWLHLKNNKKNIIGISNPNFFMYTIYSNLLNFKICKFNIDPSKSKKIDVNFLKKFIKKNKITSFFLVNPSHPFEKFWTNKEVIEIIKFCKKRKVFLIIDEAYGNLGSKSDIQHIIKFKNVLLVETFSKNYGLPGLRFGYLIGHKTIIKQLMSFRLSYEISSYTAKKVIELLNNKNIIRSKINSIKSSRKFAHMEFKKRGIKSYGNYGNSVTFGMKTKKITQALGRYLKKKTIIINFNYTKPFQHYLNITTTNKNNLKLFFSKLDNFIQ